MAAGIVERGDRAVAVFDQDDVLARNRQAAHGHGFEIICAADIGPVFGPDVFLFLKEPCLVEIGPRRKGGRAEIEQW